MTRYLQLIVAAACILGGLQQVSAGEAAADAHYANIIDPVKLGEISSSVMAPETFDAALAVTDVALTDGLAGKGLDLTTSKKPLVFDCAKVLNPSAGAVSWWLRFRSEVTDASILLALNGNGSQH